MLDLKIDRPITTPKDAATVVLVRDGAAGLEVFCVERSKQSRFLGGAIVFPGGKLDEADRDAAWTTLATAPRIPSASTLAFTTDEAHLRALAVAAARETLEEAAILHTTGTSTLDHETVLALRGRLTSEPRVLEAFLRERALRLDLAALHPFARWVTPEAEARRYDARFFVAVAPPDQRGAHDEHETMASFWATPAELLRRWEAGEVQIAPPTHCTIAELAGLADAAAVVARAATTNKDPICPRLVRQLDPGDGRAETLALALPGDPEHEVKERRAFGPSRYVLRGNRWLPEDAPG